MQICVYGKSITTLRRLSIRLSVYCRCAAVPCIVLLMPHATSRRNAQVASFDLFATIDRIFAGRGALALWSIYVGDTPLNGFDSADPQPLLSLRDASALLGVHPSTLRRWADAGEVPVTITPGGHRRFARADLERFSADRQRLRVLPGSERAWAQQAIVRTRSALGQGEPAWHVHITDEVRAQQRGIGQRLMGIVLRYVAAQHEDPAALHEAQQVGAEYAASARALGMPLTAALESTLFFRDALVDAAMDLPNTLPIQPDANSRLLRRINRVLNAVQLAIAASYE